MPFCVNTIKLFVQHQLAFLIRTVPFLQQTILLLVQPLRYQVCPGTRNKGKVIVTDNKGQLEASMTVDDQTLTQVTVINSYKPEPTPTPEPTVTPETTITPKASITPNPTEIPKPSNTPAPETKQTKSPKTGYGPEETGELQILLVFGALMLIVVLSIEKKKR